ncbi:tetratricopeptide repeat protein [Limibacter armeniacum]|uniref:tetratricopeptide repeat protein n=1 Tax=Limibacter armeniacum TaxID=466084 RepID=UPI002FE6925F
MRITHRPWLVGLLILTSTFFISQQLIAQTEVETLQKQVEQTQDKHQQVDKYNLLASNAIEYNQFKDAIDYSQKALDLAEELDYYKGSATALLNFANVYRLKRQFKQALNYALQGVNIYKEKDDLPALYQAYTEVAYLYQDWNVFDNAIDYEKKALAVANQLKDPEKGFDVVQLLAFSYMKMGQDDQALKYLIQCRDYHKQSGDNVQYVSMLSRIASIQSKKGDFQAAMLTNLEIIRIKRQTNDTKGLATYLNDVGYSYQRLGNTKMALRYLEEAVEHNRKEGLPEKANTTLLTNMGVINMNSGNVRKGLENYLQVLEIQQKHGTSREISNAHIYVASAYESLRLYSEARKHADAAIELARQGQHFDVLTSAYTRKLAVYEGSGNYKKALQTMKSFLALKDSLLNMERTSLTEQQKQWKEAQKKEKELEKVLMEKKMSEQEIDKLRIDAELSKKQLELLERERALKNSKLRQEELEGMQTQQQLLMAQEQLNLEKRQQEIYELQKEKKLNELLLRQKDVEERERQKAFELLERENELRRLKLKEEEEKRKYFIASMALLCVVLALILIGYFQNRMKNKRLAAKNDEILQQKQEIEQQRDQISVAKQEVEKVNDDFQVLSEFGQKITSTLDFGPINWTAFAYVNSLMDAGVFGIGIYDETYDSINYINLLDNGVSVPHFGFKLSDTNSLSVLCFKSQEEILISELDLQISQYLKSQPVFQTGERPESLVYMPLTADQKPLGVLTVQSFEKNAYTRKDVNILRSMASYISIALTNANAYKEINTKNKHITDSMRYAQTIQKAILPTPAKLKRDLLDSFIMFRPKDIVSGDYYWYSKIEGDDLVRGNLRNPFTESLIFLVVADCTGHGVPGGFMSMIGNTLLNEIINQKHIYDPAEILHRLDEGIIRALHQENKSNDDGMDVSLCVIEKSGTETDKIIFAGAKRPMWYIENGNNTLVELKGTNKSIGGLRFKKSSREFEEHTVQLGRGSLIYLSSDGMADQNNGEGKKYGKVKLIELLEQNAEKTMLDQLEALELSLEEHQGKVAQRDDITIVGVRL